MLNDAWVRINDSNSIYKIRIILHLQEHDYGRTEKIETCSSSFYDSRRIISEAERASVAAAKSLATSSWVYGSKLIEWGLETFAIRHPKIES